MAVFRVERIKDYTVMSNHHLRNKNLSLKAKGLLSQMLSLPDDWDYTLKGLAAINKESVDAIRTAIWELEDTGYVVRTRVRDERGCLRGCDYYVYEYPQASSSGSDGSAESVPPMLEPLASDSAVQENPIQLNKEIQNVVIDISELSGDLLTVGMYIGLDYMWDKAKEDLTRRKQIFIDEVWQIIGASSNALAANYVFEAVKTIRGYGGGVLVATQDLNDFFSLEDVELLGYSFTSGDLCAATEEERQRQLHYDFSEGTASVAGIYVKATEDFSVTLTYTDSEKSLTKALHVTLDDSAPFPGILQDRFAQEAQPATCSADAGVAAYASLQVTQCVYTSVGWIDQRTTHRVGIVDFTVVERLIIHAVRSGGQQPQGAAADALQLLGGGCCGFRGRSRCRRAVRCGLSAGCQGQRQRGSDSKIFLHDISSPYCVFSAAKVCGVMLAAESVTLYPLAFATA